MENTLSLAAADINTRIQACIALQISTGMLACNPITDDNSPAINQSIIFAFSHAIVNVAPWVADFSINPPDASTGHDSNLLLELTFNTIGSASPDCRLARRALEEYIVSRILSEIIPVKHLADRYETIANDSLLKFIEIIALPAAGSPLRLTRSY